MLLQCDETGMTELTVRDILEVTGGTLLTDDSSTFSGVSTDSRTVSEGELFVALRGERFDGHDFVEDALSKAGGAIVESRPENLPQGKVVIVVDDALRSLQELAHYVRMKRDIPVIAVTGSNGKTTTKEMIYSICSTKKVTLKNEGNLNNHIGLPLSILRMEPEHELMVLEMGMNAAGEISRLCEIAAPTHGVITNVGRAHIGRLGSYEEVRSAKLELLPGLQAACVNADDAGLMGGVRYAEGFEGRLFTFGIEQKADIVARDISMDSDGMSFVIDLGDAGMSHVRLSTVGIFNIYNALAASAVCSLLGFGPEEIRAGLDAYRPYAMRFEVIEAGGCRIINDSYNANPSSMEASLREFARMAGEGRKVAVLGDMFELGRFADEAHEGIVALAASLDVDMIIAVGEQMGRAAGKVDGPDSRIFPDVDAACREITAIVKPGDTVLVKGSRSMALEKVVERLRNAL
jgi:UDP-N-acetylmuramoyl-tripeptide--D-alanyl-D-alanine ligase